MNESFVFVITLWIGAIGIVGVLLYGRSLIRAQQREIKKGLTEIRNDIRRELRGWSTRDAN